MTVVVRFIVAIVLVIVVTDASNLVYLSSASAGIGGVLSVAFLLIAYFLSTFFLKNNSDDISRRYAYTDLLIALAVLYASVFFGIYWIRFDPRSLTNLGAVQLLILTSTTFAFLLASRLDHDRLRNIMQAALVVYVGSIFYELFSNGLISETIGDRPGGFLINPNDGAFMTAALLLLSLPWEGRSATGYIWILIATAGVVVTLSRSGLFLLFAVSVPFAYSRIARGSALARVVTLSVAAFALFAVLAFVAAPETMAKQLGIKGNIGRIQSIALVLTGNTSALNDSERGSLLNLWTRECEERPFLGAGSYYSTSDMGPFSGMKHLGPHNMYVARMADSGIIGLLSLIGFLFLTTVSFLSREFSIGVAYAVFFAVACFFSHNLADCRPLIALFGILAAQSVSQTRTTTDPLWPPLRVLGRES